MKSKSKYFLAGILAAVGTGILLKNRFVGETKDRSETDKETKESLIGILKEAGMDKETIEKILEDDENEIPLDHIKGQVGFIFDDDDKIHVKKVDLDERTAKKLLKYLINEE